MQGPSHDLALGNSALGDMLGFTDGGGNLQSAPSEDSDPGLHYLQASVESGIAAGFQIAAANGPLCDEPMWGVAFEVSRLPSTAFKS